MRLVIVVPAIERRHGTLVGVVISLDAAARTVVVGFADGTEHAFHIVGRTTVHGTEEVVAGTKDTFHRLKEGSVIAAHYTAKGTQETAEEVDNIGKVGLKATDAIVTRFDRAATALIVDAAEGTQQTYRLSDNASEDADKDIAEGTEKSAKVSIN